ncbi:MAG: alpha-amylase family glycosyl hydrolase [Candidatus Limnocylindrales bacterium]|nr:alpha-amylase family glycosyl hydrolase [Candidatus Limnocylindrales bacterium]
MRDFHVRREPRERYAVASPLIGSRGDLVVADLAGIRRLAARMNIERAAGAPSVSAGEIAALGLLHEIGHVLIARYEQNRRPGAINGALTDLEARLGPEAARLLDRFGQEFPGRGPEPEPPAHRLEELLLTRISNENPALGPLQELVDDRALARGTRYAEAIAGLEAIFAEGPPFDVEGISLIELMRAPARHAPTSLAGQLRYIRERWGPILGAALEDLLRRLDLAIGIIAEEERALHLRFGGGTGGPGGHAETPSFAGAAEEPEAFSSDSAWMPRVVLLAKSTYVWLDQLSRTYRRNITTLDAIPDEELDTLARWGVTGLWLIGLWERSAASERIKRMRGNTEAVASAYSLDDYRIAGDLGGELAYAELRDRAAARGIRLASDMVPNHVGIDSRWVIEHPEWFLSLPEPPYPAYSFNGPDLSADDRVGIAIEDHYWDDSDAAVVFKRFDRQTGDVRYVYHGNDGTSFPWNDTAQLNFLDPAVREQVIRTILDVARRFPIIRFDAAMVLARKHIERLWWPEPGAGAGIPSRAEHAMSKREFDARMPVEFWREVVDRVAAEIPGTLLLAEAFWLLEGYFVRTLGMHRVYNSAFMHMLRDEDGAGYRKVIKETIEFDPEILKRYVNFMSNPDEKTALEQFGKGDKYFGVAIMLATLPGLPMLGHGQVQGFGEKYGMEFRRATLDERPDPELVARHEREIFPLLHRRAWFAEAHDFLLYDFVIDGGGVDEHVFAYSNGAGPERSLVIFHDRFGSTSGSIRDSAVYAVKSPDGSRRLVRRSLADGLGLPNEPGAYVIFRDSRTGLESLRSCRELWERGLHLSLDAYSVHVFWEFREVRDRSAGQWARLATRLAGGAVPSLDVAMRELQLEPVHAPFRAIFAEGLVRAVLDGEATPTQLDELERRYAAFLAATAEATGLRGDPASLAAVTRGRIERVFRGSTAPDDRKERSALLAWLAFSRIGELAPAADVVATSRAWYEELRLPGSLAAGLREAGLDEPEAWAVADLVRTLLALPRPSGLRRPARTSDGRLLDQWLARDVVRTAIGLNTWQGVEYIDRDAFDAMLRWAVRLDAIDAGSAAPAGSIGAGGAGTTGTDLATRLSTAAEAAGYRVDRMRADLAKQAAGSPKARAVKRLRRGA